MKNTATAFNRAHETRLLAIAAIAFVALVPIHRANADAPETPAATAKFVDPQTKQLLDDAQRAISGGNFDLAAIQLKSALRVKNDPEVRGTLGIVQFRLGNVPETEREIRQALADGASTTRFLPVLLDAMLSLQEFHELLTDYPEPTDPRAEAAVEIMRSRGAALAALSQFDAAKADLDRALETRRDSNGLTVRARLALQQNDLTLATSLVNEAMKLDPKDTIPKLLMVEIDRRNNDQAAALNAADEIVKSAPGNILAQIERITLLVDMHREDDADKAIDDLLVRMPKQPAALYFKSVVQARRHNYIEAWRTAQNLAPEFVQADPSTAVTVAGIAIDARAVESADTILTSVISKHPGVETDIYKRVRMLEALVHLKQNKPDLALEVLEPLKDSKDPVVVGYRAQASIQLHRFDDALTTLDTGDAKSSGNPTLQQELAVSQLGAGQTDAGLKQLTELFDTDPSQVTYASLLVGMESRLGRFAEAEAAIAEMESKVGPKNPYPAFFRAQIASQQGQTEKALGYFSTSLEADSTFLPSYFLRAMMLMSVGEYAGARRDLDAVLKLDPNNVSAILKKADVAAREGHSGEVVEIFEAGIARLPGEPKLRLGLAGFYLRGKRYDDAYAVAKKMRDSMPDDSSGLALMGSVLMLQGHYTDAVARFRELVAMKPDLASAKYRLYDAFIAAGDRVSAITLLQTMVDADPKDFAARQALIRAHIQAQHGDAALATATDYRTAHPGPDADALYAVTLFQLGRPDDAKSFLQKQMVDHGDAKLVQQLAEMERGSDGKKARALLFDWLNKHPKDFQTRLTYAEMLSGFGDDHAARDQYEQVLRDQPNDPVALNNLGWLLRKDDSKRALELLARAFAIEPDSPQVVDTLGWVKFLSGKQKEAVPILEQAHSMAASDPSAAYHLAAALHATGGDAGRTRGLLKEALGSTEPFDDAAEAKQLAASVQ